MRDPVGTLIRFAGVLREDHVFIHIPAWETSTVFERPEEGDGDYVVDLTDGRARVVSRAFPRIEFRDIEDPDASGLRLADVLVYVPMHPEARELIFRRIEPHLEIFRSELSERPPIIEDIVVQRGRRRGRVLAQWRVTHDRPVTFTVFLTQEQQPTRVIASGLVESAVELDTTTLGGPDGRLAVAASDGFRTSTTIGPVIENLPAAARLEIASPEPGLNLPPDQPVSLIAQAVDASGRVVQPEEVTWEVDGQLAGEGQLAVAAPLEPGDHKIVANGTVDGTAVGPAEVAVTVVPRNEEQEEFARAVAQLPLTRDLIRDVED